MARTRWRLAAAAALVVCLTRTEERPALAAGDPAAADALAAGRALFAEALADEEAGRFRVALDKFLRVRSVRDTAPVEYRVGTCEEALGHLPPAYGAYRSAVALGEGDPSMTDVVKAARDRTDALSTHVARLLLVLPDPPAAGMAVQIDDVSIAPDALARPVPLEPGTHTVVVTAEGTTPFRNHVALPEGAEASLPVVLASQAVAPIDRAPSGGATGRTLGWILAGAGAALLGGAGAALLLRHDDIATLGSACPGGLCPASQKGELESTRDRALAEGPIAVALAAAGLVATATGVYLLVAPPSAATTAPAYSPRLPTTLAIAGVFP